MLQYKCAHSIFCGDIHIYTIYIMCKIDIHSSYFMSYLNHPYNILGVKMYIYENEISIDKQVYTSINNFRSPPPHSCYKRISKNKGK